MDGLNKARVLVTGATGFIGRAVCHGLLEAGAEVVAETRNLLLPLPAAARPVLVPSVDETTDWGEALAGVDRVVHLASPAHILGEPNQATIALFRRVSVDGTLRLAQAARAAGVRQFVYVSSVKVNGEQSLERPFTEADPPDPQDVYSTCKLIAERALADLDRDGSLGLTILRPPLVYGPGVKGNLLGLVRLCALGLPLPFQRIDNRRSFIHLDNLAHVIALCLSSPVARGRTYLVRDGQDLSTAELVRLICQAFGYRPLMLDVSKEMLVAAGRLIGRDPQVQRLFGSLAIDDGLIRRELGWSPPFAIEHGIARMVADFRANRGRRRGQQVVFPSTKPTLPGVSVVIVSYNNNDIGPVLDAVVREPRVGEIIIVDNGNHAATRDELTQLAAGCDRIRVIRGHGNVGFAAGCNIGVALARGEHLLLLNPDCYLQAGTVPRLVELFAGSTGRWVAGIRLVNTDGSEQKGARRNLGSPLEWLVEAFRLDRLPRPMAARIPPRVNLNEAPLPAGTCAIPAISGAFMFMRRAVYEELGGMDQRYFLHFEDLDFCMVMHKAGGQVYFVPEMICYHRKSQSKAPPLFVEYHKCRSMKNYFLKHFAAGARLRAMTIWAVLSAGLMLRGIFRNLFIPGRVV